MTGLPWNFLKVFSLPQRERKSHIIVTDSWNRLSNDNDNKLRFVYRVVKTDVMDHLDLMALLLKLGALKSNIQVFRDNEMANANSGHLR
ncbi:hypothetical protein KIN20_025301 [Parelaphostrongylus tenuis]|uniref:Uncharacterized protein n=1 Tax=Parelaphostrongylus tenuis TaxID=148309 RepID=A0AAD5QWW1_PARTN|nr:hypothetical protein KIN20_025301 [Parelaphostrongylus tenuis]